MSAPDWTALPKVELHLHLEGAAPPAFVRALAAEKGRDLPGVFDPEGGYAWTDFAHFLEVYETVTALLETPDDYRRLAEAVLRQSAADGVVYAEIFLAPDLCAPLAAWPEFLAAMAEGADAVPEIAARFVPVAIRHFGRERAEAAARAVVAAPHPRVTGFGLAGEERHGHPCDYAQTFAIAAEAGLGLTAHAGEIAGPESVAAALDCLPVTRIGHGVRAIEDPTLVARLAAEGVTLEVCPGSNLALGLYPDWPSHPVARLRAARVPVTLSTDDPPYFHTTLPREYAALAAAFGWTPADFAAINRDAARAAFCDEATRAQILARLGPHPETA